MDDAEIFERWVRAHEQGDTETLAECMDDDFVFEQEGLPKSLDKEEYVALVEELHNAFPDLGFEASSASIGDEGTVRWQQAFSAKHEQDLDLTRLDLPFFFSTGHEVDLEGERALTRVRDGQITEHVVDEASGGVGGLISELEHGVESLRSEARQRNPSLR